MVASLVGFTNAPYLGHTYLMPMFPSLGIVQGAVEWRKEIEGAIQGCSKFVSFIDYQYLLSFNCLEVRPDDPIRVSPLRSECLLARDAGAII